MRVVALALCAVLLASCGRSFVADQMVADPSVVVAPQMQSEINLSPVSSTFDPNVGAALWILVPPDDIEAALSDSLASAGLLSQGDGRFELTAVPRSLYQDGRFRFTFTAAIDYRLIDATTGEEILDETVAVSRQMSEAASWSRTALIGEIETLIASNFAAAIDEFASLNP